MACAAPKSQRDAVVVNSHGTVAQPAKSHTGTDTKQSVMPERKGISNRNASRVCVVVLDASAAFRMIAVCAALRSFHSLVAVCNFECMKIEDVSLCRCSARSRSVQCDI